MRILHVVHQFPPETRGGLEGYVHDLAAAQKNAGHEVFVISGSMEPRSEVGCESDPAGEFTVERIHRSDLYFDSWDKGYCPEVGLVLRDRLEELRPDVLHLHHWIRLTSDIEPGPGTGHTRGPDPSRPCDQLSPGFPRGF